MSAHPVVDLIILCGFLGSGKTSLLVDFLNQEQLHDTAVIINEAGAIGLDGTLVFEDGGEQAMTVLANGCVCCSLRSSLVDTVIRVLDTARPQGSTPLRRIVLETSGLSKPGPIIASLNDPELLQRGLRLMVLSTYDAVLGGLRLEQFEEASAQLIAAQRIVFTKIDLVDSSTLERQLHTATNLNPLADLFFNANRRHLVEAAFSNLEQGSETLRGALDQQLSASIPVVSHPRIHVMQGQTSGGLCWDDLSNWLDNLAGLCGERLLRTKLLVSVTDCEDPILIQSVGTTYSAPRRMTQQRGAAQVFVVITRDIQADEINAQLAQNGSNTLIKLEALRVRANPRKLFDLTQGSPSVIE